MCDTTKRTELEHLRQFFRYCQDRGWLAKNRAKSIKQTTAVEEKFGMEPDEESRLFAAIEDPALRCFCNLMRHAGLRISDATEFNASNLIARVCGKGWAVNHRLSTCAGSCMTFDRSTK